LAASTPAAAAAAPIAVPAAATPQVTADALAGSSANSQPAVVYVDPTAAPGGNGSISNPYNNWSFALQPGVTYLQRAGTTFTGVIQVNTDASAGSPTLIGAYGAGAAPAIIGAVDFAGASNVEFGGFQLTNPGGAAVMIQQGSSNIEVANNDIVGAQDGVWIGNDAGSGNVVEENYIDGSIGAGILVDSTSSTANDETVISGNTVVASGADGILLSTNYAEIAGNTVAYNGLTTPATSGIHVYTSSATEGTGQYDTITDNLVGYNRDATMQDGNGILLDQWTANNTVSDNFVLGNDGAGIALYDSAANFISDNVTGDNGVNSGGSHTTLAELIVNQSLGLTTDNVISGNTFLAFLPTGFAAFVDTGSTNAGNVFAGNVLENLIGPDVFQVNGVRGPAVATWNSMLGASDQFSGVAIATPTADTTYAYTFPAGTMLDLDGRAVTLTGWSPTGGLYGTT
jgi:parallel beta-helix repeat protein